MEQPVISLCHQMVAEFLGFDIEIQVNFEWNVLNSKQGKSMKVCNILHTFCNNYISKVQNTVIYI
jgi:hypothetical protein